jgi:hypothetical protein
MYLVIKRNRSKDDNRKHQLKGPGKLARTGDIQSFSKRQGDTLQRKLWNVTISALYIVTASSLGGDRIKERTFPPRQM